jgi:hypothetical protein
MIAVSATVGFARTPTTEAVGKCAAYGPRHHRQGIPSNNP